MSPTHALGNYIFVGSTGNRKSDRDSGRRGRELFQQKKTCDRKRTRVSPLIRENSEWRQGIICDTSNFAPKRLIKVPDTFISKKSHLSYNKIMLNSEKPNKTEEDLYVTLASTLLENAPSEIVELLKEKKYYHVTLKSASFSILKEGLKKDSETINKRDMEFFETMYYKYSNRRDDGFLEYHIKGKNGSDNRGIYVSSHPDSNLYQIPERLKFFLANLNFIIKSGRLDEKELEKAKSIFEKYYSELKKDKVVTLEIGATAPAIVYSILKGWDLSDPDTTDDLKSIINQYEPNFKIKENIDQKFIKISEDHELSTTELDRGINDTAFVIF